MSGKPAEAFIGLAGLGMGILVAYGALTNKKIFGSGGLLTTVIQTGKFPDLATLPPWFGAAMVTGDGSLTQSDAGAAEAAALASIAAKDPALAAQLTAAIKAWNPVTTPTVPDSLEALITEAREKGFTDEAAALQQFVDPQADSTPTPTTGAVFT